MSTNAPKQLQYLIGVFDCRDLLSDVLKNAGWEADVRINLENNWLEATANKEIGDGVLSLHLCSEKPNEEVNYHLVTKFSVNWEKEPKDASRLIDGRYMLVLIGKAIAGPHEVPMKGTSFAIEKPVDFLSLLESYDRVANKMGATTLLT